MRTMHTQIFSKVFDKVTVSCCPSSLPELLSHFPPSVTRLLRFGAPIVLTNSGWYSILLGGEARAGHGELDH